jgi:hypothetical protein
MNLREDSLDPLIDLLRSGTQDVIKLAVKAALADVLNQHADAQTSDGRAAIVRNSYHPGREILTSVGPVMIQFQRSAHSLANWSAAGPRSFGLTFLRLQDQSAATIDPLTLPQTLPGSCCLQG